MNDRRLVWTATVAILVMCNAMIAQKEHQLHNGESLYFELAPKDPRSLMQGDYMRLDYSISRAIDDATQKSRGGVIVRVDAEGVARFERVGVSAQAPNERVVRWKRDAGGVEVGADSYFFEEGRAAHFERARYAELKVGSEGETLLVRLLDGELKPL